MKSTTKLIYFALSLSLILVLLSLNVTETSQAASLNATWNSSFYPKIYNPDNHHWYQVIDTPMTWHAARDYCGAAGGYLVTIESADENAFVYDLLDWSWLGATDESEEGVWRWVNGELLSYTNWADDEPNNGEWTGHDGPYEHYLSFKSETSGKWNDIANGSVNFICEYTQGKPADFARAVVGKPYHIQSGDLTSKGWDGNGFSNPEDIEHLDCSGLIYWAYNKSRGAVSYSSRDNPVLYENANGIYQHNSTAISESDLRPGDMIVFDWKKDGIQDGIMDHVVMYVGNDQIVSAQSPGSSLDPGYVGLFSYDAYMNSRRALMPDNGFRRIPKPEVNMEIEVHSPVNLSITDPDGNVIAHDSWTTTDEEAFREIANTLYYTTWSKSGHNFARVYSPSATLGNWHIEVLPKPGAAGTDTYTLITIINGEETTLAANIAVDDIPPNGYEVHVEASPSFTSTDNTHFSISEESTFTITTTGFPTPTLSLHGVLPKGIAFRDNTDGSASLSGTPILGSEGIYSLSLTASNGMAPDSVQIFSLTVDNDFINFLPIFAK